VTATITIAKNKKTTQRRGSRSSSVKTKPKRSSARRHTKPSYSDMMAMRGQHWPFKTARAFVRKLGLKSYQEWQVYCQGQLKGKKQKPLEVPRNPRDTYREKGWAGFADWLGTGNIAYRHHQWRAFNPARAFVRKLKLPNTQAWRAYVRGDYSRLPMLPKDIPTNPDRIYHTTGWKGFGDWLGSGNPSPARRKSRKKRSAR
jgi:hypothetical protein